jgi:hypothetical protein
LKLLSFVFLFLVLLDGVNAAEKFEGYLEKALMKLDANSLAALRQDVQKTQLELENQSNPIEIRGVLGTTTVGGFSGKYDEFEVSYEIELSGEKRRFRSEVLPILNKVSELEARGEINEVKFSVLKLLVLFGITNERVLHAKERHLRLKKLGSFLRNIKQKSPQSLANKNLIRLKIEEIEFELYELKLELTSLNRLIDSIFEDRKIVDNLKRSPTYGQLEEIYKKILNLPSKLKDYYSAKLLALKKQEQISEKSWVPDLVVYGGQNAQDQLGSQPQFTRYLGVGIRIPTDFTYSKKRKLMQSSLRIAKIIQKRDQINSESEYEGLIVNIDKMLRFLKLNNKTILNKREKELNLHFKNLGKGLISLQTYLDLDTSIHERFHNSLMFKKELIGEFYKLINLKKQSADLLGELL